MATSRKRRWLIAPTRKIEQVKNTSGEIEYSNLRYYKYQGGIFLEQNKRYQIDYQSTDKKQHRKVIFQFSNLKIEILKRLKSLLKPTMGKTIHFMNCSFGLMTEVIRRPKLDTKNLSNICRKQKAIPVFIHGNRQCG